MAAGIFITGTDTGVGKTTFCALLLRALRSRGIDAVGIKPFCCGDRSDAEILHSASGEVISLSEVNPVWLRVPAAPYTACVIENRSLDVATALETIKALSQKHAFLVIEGVGGWRVPLTQQLCMSQFATSLGYPVLVVAANRLGVLNHTQLTLDSITAHGARCLGVVLGEPVKNEQNPATLTNKGILEDLLTIPILGELGHGSTELDPNLEQRLLSALSLPLPHP
jgi:dethiobiotin synthetase